MSSYNHEAYLPIAIESVLNQTFKDFELIILDDASSDHSKEVIRYYSKRDPRIRAYFHKKNRGIARTMNDLLAKANGKYVATFASDDVWAKNKLEKQMAVLKENDNLVVWTEGEVIDKNGNPTGELFTHIHGAAKKKKKSGWILNELLEGNFICSQSVLVKRKNIVRIGYDERLKYVNDYKLMLDLAAKYEFYFIPEPLTQYRIHGRNTIISKRKELRREELIISQYVLEKYGKDMSPKTMSRVYFNMAHAYLTLGNRLESARFTLRGFLLDPISVASLKSIASCVLGERLSAALRSVYHKTKP